ncbi:hypothetical protein OY14_01990 [Borreliella chilensis]|uniref:Uncharacterized protein n=1 Tax=Borreliella chilensis TaxID=1245910 RepID=A0A0A7UVV7_9SPIR|nr:hypothetical protein OY14_01990 [Borreliella chilensis]
MNELVNNLKLALKSFRQIKFYCKCFKTSPYTKTYLMQIHQFILFLKIKNSRQKYLAEDLMQINNKINSNIKSSSIIVPVIVIKNFLINKAIKNLTIKFCYQNKQKNIDVFNFSRFIKNILKTISKVGYKKGEFQ